MYAILLKEFDTKCTPFLHYALFIRIQAPYYFVLAVQIMTCDWWQ